MEDSKTSDPTVLPRSLCNQFPSSKACTENLPSLLLRSETFRFIIKILPEIKLQDLFPSRVFSSVKTSKYPSQKQNHQEAQFHEPEALREVKQERVDLEENFHHAHNADSELHDGWSLGRVEDLFMENDQLKGQVEGAFEILEASCEEGEEERPLPSTLLPWYRFNHQNMNELLSFVDEKPSLLQPNLIHAQNPEDLQSHTDNDGFLAFQASMEASLLPHIIPTNTSQALFVNENNRIQNIEPTNISMSEVKTEPKESLFLSSPKVSNHRALVKRVCRKRNTTRRAAQWLSNKNAFAALKLIIGGTIKHKQTKKKKVQFQQSGNLKPWKPKVSKILKLKHCTTVTKKRPKIKMRRETNCVLALPAIFSEEDISQLGNEYCRTKRKHCQLPSKRESFKKQEEAKDHNVSNNKKSSLQHACDTNNDNESILQKRKRRMLTVQKSEKRVMFGITPSLDERQTVLPSNNDGDHLDYDGKVRENPKLIAQHDEGFTLYQQNFLSRSELKGPHLSMEGSSYLEGEIGDAVVVRNPVRIKEKDVSSEEWKIKDEALQEVGSSLQVLSLRKGMILNPNNKEKSPSLMHPDSHLTMNEEYLDCLPKQ